MKVGHVSSCGRRHFALLLHTIGAIGAGVAEAIAVLDLWTRDPPVRFRKSVPDCWLRVTISETAQPATAADDGGGGAPDAAAGAVGQWSSGRWMDWRRGFGRWLGRQCLCVVGGWSPIEGEMIHSTGAILGQQEKVTPLNRHAFAGI